MDLRKNWWAIPLCISAAIILTIAWFVLFSVEGVYKINMDVTVQSSIAFNLDSDALHFGGGMPGTDIERAMKITNAKLYSVQVELFTQGEISPWVVTNEPKFVIGPNETRNVTFTAYIPANATYGNHTGEIVVTIKRA